MNTTDLRDAGQKRQDDAAAAMLAIPEVRAHLLAATSEPLGISTTDTMAAAGMCWDNMDRSEIGSELADSITWADLNKLAETNRRVAVIRDLHLEWCSHE